jgi:hypothetical protein
LVFVGSICLRVASRTAVSSRKRTVSASPGSTASSQASSALRPSGEIA